MVQLGQDGVMNMSEFPKDLDTQAGIANCGGLKDLYKRALLRFRADINARPLAMNAPVVDDEWKRWIHSLKSTSALLGAKELNETVKEIESYWRQNQDAPELLWAQMNNYYTKVGQDLNEWHESQNG